jgi:hypothetical protein
MARARALDTEVNRLMQDWKRKTWLYVGVFFIYALLTLVMTWPLVARFSTHLIGHGDDMWVHYWNDWWVKRTLRTGGDLYYTDLMFYPKGVSLVYHNFAWFNIALWLALGPLIGGIAAYNLTHILHIPLCGLGMFLLVARLTKSKRAAFVSGLIYAFYPNRMLDVDHPNIIATEGFPFLLLILLNLFEGKRTIRDGILAGLVVALIGYMRWQLLILAGLMVLLYLLCTLIWQRERWNRRTITGLACCVAVAAVLMVPGIYPYLREHMIYGSADEVYAVRSAVGKHDLLTYVVPQWQHLLGPLHDPFTEPFSTSLNRQRYTAFLGYVATGLGIAGLARYRRKREVWLWFGLAVLSFALALGPVLEINRSLYPQIPMPYRLVSWLPPIQMLGVPLRFNALLALPVAVLGGYGALALREWLAQRRWGKWLARSAVFVVVLSGLILVDYCSIPTATIAAHVPAFYYTLAEEPGDFAIMGLPGKRKFTEYYMFYQTVHKRPLLGGHVSRLPPDALDFASSVPLIDGMYENFAINTGLPDVSRQLSMLADANFRYIVIHKKLANQQQVGAWRNWLLVRPRHEDDEVVVYPTAPVVGEDIDLQHDLGAGVGFISFNQSTEGIAPDIVVEFDVIWGTTAPPGADLALELALVDEAGKVGQAQRFEITPFWPPGEWPVNAIVRDSYALKTDPWMREGTYAVVASLVRVEDDQLVGRPVKVGEVVMDAPDRFFTTPSMEQTVGAEFGADLRLLGYDLQMAPDELDVTLHWQAQQRMDHFYKFFVHLYRAESDELVAQQDFVARNWSYPTIWWEADEVVSDEVRLPLDEVPPGKYRLATGVYDAADGKRLPVVGVEDFAVISDALILQEVVVP